jgi:hypothetical protein
MVMAINNVAYSPVVSVLPRALLLNNSVYHRFIIFGSCVRVYVCVREREVCNDAFNMKT